MVGEQGSGGAVGVLVGRAEELRLVSAAVEQRGCVVAGVVGVGKSRLAAEVAARRAAPSVRVVATGSASAIPFGAFAHLLAGVEVDARGPVAAYLEALRRRSPEVAPTLVVDDAHLLDPASAALVLAVVESGTARVVLTLRHGEPVRDAITTLWKDGWLDRLDLGPLSRRELRSLVEAELGGAAEVDVPSRVFTLTEGNPLYARELLVDARGCGALAQRDGRWCWTGEPPRLRRLRELIGDRTRDLGDEGRTALQVLAVGGPLAWDEVVAASGERGVTELESAGIAVLSGAPESPTVELAHPLFSEVTIAEMPVATARAHRRRLADVIRERSTEDSMTLLRLALLTLESGEVDAELFVEAARHAMEAEAGVPGPGWDGGDPTLAIRLADAAGPGLLPALLGARARVALNRFAHAADHLAPLEPDAARAPLSQAAEYLRSRVNALHWSGRTDDAVALLDRARPWFDDPNWSVLQASLRAWILHDQALPATASAEVRALTVLDRAMPPLRLDALVVVALTESRLGLTGRCEALEPEIRRLVEELEREGWQTGWARHVVDVFARAEAARDLAGTEQRLRDARAGAEAAGDVALTAGLNMVLGRLALTRGHAHQAVELLHDAVDGLGSGDPRNGLGWALAHLTRAHALAGAVPDALDALARVEAIAAERPSHRRLHLELERARAWIEAAGGRVTAARQRLLAVADAAGEALLCEAEVTHDALRFGAPGRRCATRLRVLADRADSELIDAFAQHAAAVASADPHALVRAAERFAELGLDLTAAEAASAAERDFTATGQASSARHAGALTLRHSHRCAGAATPALTVSGAARQLTPRELEIATLAARGLRNAEIAAELLLSVRTVETYILRACRKLGAERRTDLADMLDPTAPT